MAPDADRARRAIPERLAEAVDSGASRDPRDRLGGDENSAMIVEWGFSIVCGTSKLLDQFAIRLENGAIGTGMLYAVGMISQCLVAYPAGHRATVLIHHQEPNAVLF
jgi:hypothetical protein